MTLLTHQRCLSHSQREAVARCPSCRNFYCRECVTEHDDRLICALCLKDKVRKEQRKGYGGVKVGARVAAAIGGFLLLYYLFFTASRLLLSVPNQFHEGTYWKPDSPKEKPLSP